MITVKGVLFNQARTLQFTEICILSATVFGILEMNLLFIYSYIYYLLFIWYLGYLL